jgi:hypothetical protein
LVWQFSLVIRLAILFANLIQQFSLAIQFGISILAIQFRNSFWFGNSVWQFCLLIQFGKAVQKFSLVILFGNLG